MCQISETMDRPMVARLTRNDVPRAVPLSVIDSAGGGRGGPTVDTPLSMAPPTDGRTDGERSAPVDEALTGARDVAVTSAQDREPG